MFGWFEKKETNFHIKEQMEDCVEQLKYKWTEYIKILPFNDEISLAYKIELFTNPAQIFVENTFPVLLSDVEQQGNSFWVMIFSAIQQSKTHSIDELNEAMAELEKKFTK